MPRSPPPDTHLVVEHGTQDQEVPGTHERTVTISGTMSQCRGAVLAIIRALSALPDGFAYHNLSTDYSPTRMAPGPRPPAPSFGGYPPSGPPYVAPYASTPAYPPYPPPSRSNSYPGYPPAAHAPAPAHGSGSGGYPPAPPSYPPAFGGYEVMPHPSLFFSCPDVRKALLRPMHIPHTQPPPPTRRPHPIPHRRPRPIPQPVHHTLPPLRPIPPPQRRPIPPPPPATRPRPRREHPWLSPSPRRTSARSWAAVGP
jgi:hypothetical protein